MLEIPEKEGGTVSHFHKLRATSPETNQEHSVDVGVKMHAILANVTHCNFQTFGHFQIINDRGRPLEIVGCYRLMTFTRIPIRKIMLVE